MDNHRTFFRDGRWPARAKFLMGFLQNDLYKRLVSQVRVLLEMPIVQKIEQRSITNTANTFQLGSE
jgi:hypothetical protein